MHYLEVSEREINLVANRLNNRPRKIRDYKTPNELFKGIPSHLLRPLRCCAYYVNLSKLFIICRDNFTEKLMR
ncbi:hypothetical protein XBJ1_3917 [Xenorhabdus bovienii SS-2004]|uniref:Uncharacterized protein n=1 Tax=Xenorhabdus bovienii (strain SS-2004) TaxID=406818 RepID=D3V5V6_XENBS|nr:hypothetical protein XBJ1_3917 [Xenorhabdus bovienii SS-2004]